MYFIRPKVDLELLGGVPGRALTGGVLCLIPSLYVLLTHGAYTCKASPNWRPDPSHCIWGCQILGFIVLHIYLT